MSSELLAPLSKINISSNSSSRKYLPSFSFTASDVIFVTLEYYSSRHGCRNRGVCSSLVGFLQSPRWTHPLNNFVDEKCVVFDPGEENKFSYTDIHKQYSNLVESLLEQFMDDIGMTSK
ncbi:hypothetical protein EMCRGX_G032206 [Ephydatia muelleri]